MTKRRVFIAINLSEKVRKKLVEFQEKWSQLPIRWVKERNLHLTLAFLGYLSDEEIVEICQTVKEIGSKHSPFMINLIKTNYWPKDKEIPRLIWIEGEKSEELDFLKEDLEGILKDSIGFSSENRGFLPHITLGRIKKWDWQKIEPEERPDISEDIPLSFEVKSIEVMESQLKKTGAEYMILELVTLQKL